jgi:hypothetical protein
MLLLLLPSGAAAWCSRVVVRQKTVHRSTFSVRFLWP